MISSWPNAILHIDGDAFFASCEQAVHPELKGRPVITGKERNIVASMSYEAKAFGIKRAVPLWEAKKLCPDVVILPSDYETYSLISKRMFAILRRFTPAVEESSIDEGFAELNGLRRIYRTSYPEIAARIRDTIEKELDIPVSAGLSVTKILAKLASKYKKPHGFTVVPGWKIHTFLKEISVQEVCGIGPNTTALLAKRGIFTVYDYISRPQVFIRQLLGKVGDELWQELRGERVYGLATAEKTSYDSVTKSKTFSPPSDEHDYVKSQLFRNLESAFIKIRRYRLRAKKIYLFLKQQDFRSAGLEAHLTRATASPLEVFPIAGEIFKELFRAGALYRATGAVLAGLEEEGPMQFDLFEDPVRVLKMQRLAESIDAINGFYGKHAVHSALGLYLGRHRVSSTTTGRSDLPQRKKELLMGETFRQRLNLPMLHLKGI